MWTIPNIGINCGCQHFIDVKSHLRSTASFVQNQRLANKLVDVLQVYNTLLAGWTMRLRASTVSLFVSRTGVALG